MRIAAYLFPNIPTLFHITHFLRTWQFITVSCAFRVFVCLFLQDATIGKLRHPNPPGVGWAVTVAHSPRVRCYFRLFHVHHLGCYCSTTHLYLEIEKLDLDPCLLHIKESSRTDQYLSCLCVHVKYCIKHQNQMGRKCRLMIVSNSSSFLLLNS